MARYRHRIHPLTGPLAALLLAFLLNASAWAWDGNWTNGVSGRGWDIFEDSGRSDGQAGSDPPQQYWKAGPRDYTQVDPEELKDYFEDHNRDYAPYALARVEQELRYQNFILPKGYYLVKPGDANDGSSQANLGSLQASPGGQTLAQPMTRPSDLHKRVAFYQSFVILKQGRVQGVVPVHRMRLYKLPKGSKTPRQALAWVEWENQHAVLKFYYKKWLYETDFQ